MSKTERSKGERSRLVRFSNSPVTNATVASRWRWWPLAREGSGMFLRKRQTPMDKATRHLERAVRIASDHFQRFSEPTAHESAELARFARLLLLNHSTLTQMLTESGLSWFEKLKRDCGHNREPSVHGVD